MKPATYIAIAALLAVAACTKKPPEQSVAPAVNDSPVANEPSKSESKPADETADGPALPENKPTPKLRRGYSRELKVLYVEQRFRHEARFLNENLKRDEGLAYQGFFFDAQDGWTQPTSIWSEEVKRRVRPLSAPFYDAERDLMVTKKNGQIHMDYDVVIVGDIEPDSFLWQPIYWDWLEEWVKLGGGLILLSGQVHNPRDYSNNEKFRVLCPVDLDFPEGHETIVNTSKLKYIARTEAGTGHELFQFSDKPEREAEYFGAFVDGKFQPGELHGLYWYQVPGKPVEGATVLARVASEGGKPNEGEPLIVTKEVGKGRVLYLGTDDFHYWRQFVGDFYFRLFWQNAIRWVSNDPGK